MSDIDWKKVHASRVSACCQKAAADFNLSVTIPFALETPTGDRAIYLAHFPHVGPSKGILVCLAADWDKLSDVAHEHNFTCVGIHPETCSTYDRTRWGNIVSEWQALSS